MAPHDIQSPFRLLALAAWLTVVTLTATVIGLAWAPLTPGMAMLLLLVAILPPTVVQVVFRGAPPKSINQVLYEEEQTAARGPRLPASRMRL